MVRYIIYLSLGWALTLFLTSCSKQEGNIQPQLRSLTECVYSSLVIQPDSFYAVYATVTGILDSNLVEEGDLVKAGDHLFKVVDRKPLLQSENARLSKELAESNYEGQSALVAELENEVAMARLQFQNDSINFDRQNRLWKQGIGAQNTFDQKKLAFEVSKGKLAVLEGKLERTQYQLLTQLKQAENNYQSSLVERGEYWVESKINGKVYHIQKDPGELITTQQELAYIGSAKAFVVEMAIDEVDIVRVQVGQKVLVSIDAYEKEVFQARVSKIYPKMDQRSQTFLVEALFTEQPETLYPGLTGEANIIISETSRVLTIPLGYLFEENKVLTDDGEVEVRMGAQNLEFVEILDGLDTTSVLIKPE